MKHIERTRSEPSTSASKPDSDAPLWLQEQVYAPKRQRTIDLVKQSIEDRRKGASGSRWLPLHLSQKALISTGQGVSESAILNNEEAKTLYEQHRTWKGPPRHSPSITKRGGAVRTSTKLDRNEEVARQRYLRLSKAELVDRLLAAECAYAEQEQRWLEQQDEALTWRLRADNAEARLNAISRHVTETDK